MSIKIFRFLAVLFLLLAFLGIPYQRAFACSCGGFGDQYSQHMEWSDAVFSGRVVSLHTNPNAVHPYGADDTLVTLYASAVWKGERAPSLSIITNLSEDACGTEFEIGRDYLVVAKRDGSVLKTGLCHGTTLFKEARPEFLAWLGKGKEVKSTRQHPILLPLSVNTRGNSRWNCRKFKVCQRTTQYACELVAATAHIPLFCKSPQTQ